MRLFVLGNINAGKSFFIEKLKHWLKNYTILKIDDYRIHHCDGSIEKEEQLWYDFPKEILKYEDVIVELSGGGKVSKNILDELEENSFLVIKVEADIQTCLERMKEKDFSKIPYPSYPNAGTIEETIQRIRIDMQNGIIEKTWNKAIQIISVNTAIDVSCLPLYQYEQLFKVQNCLKEVKCSLFLFGSAGRKTMTVNSDVDMFLLTKEPLSKIKNMLESYFYSVRIMSNEIILRNKNILIEINYITDIEDAHEFYQTSHILNPQKTILKDDFKIISYLNNFAQEKIDTVKIITFTVERLYYFIESLPTLICKDDEYKYYFHNNIIVHEYVKLKAFLSGCFDFSYLPLNAKKYLSNSEWSCILYQFGDDREKHYNIAKELGLDIIRQVEEKYDIKFNI